MQKNQNNGLFCHMQSVRSLDGYSIHVHNTPAFYTEYMFLFQNVLNHFIFIKVRVAMYMYTVFSIQATHQLSAICFIL